MKIDGLKEELRACNLRAELRMQLDLERLRAARLSATASAMRRLGVYLFLELSLNAIAVLALGSFLAAHLREPRFLLPALLLQIAAIAHVAFGGFQLVRVGRVDLAAPVMMIQKNLEELRIGRIQMTKWTLLLAPLLWIPLLVVTLEGLWGIDTYAAFDRAWLIANVLFGVAFVPVMLWTSNRVADRFRGSPTLRRLLRDMGGANLGAAEGFLKDVARFESEGG